jgi:penicillin-binding protein 2
VLDENGNVAMPDEPKVRDDLRKEVSPEQIDLVREGLWKVVNERGGTGGGGTGARVQIKGVTVAGKTGTAQASELGKREHIAWLACFAPYEHPKYVVIAMVQGGNHGGSVAGPVAQRILSQALELSEGKLDVKLTKLEPANNPKPFEQYDALTDYKDDPNVSSTTDDSDGESADSREPSEAKVQMSHSSSPDIRESADEQGKVKKHKDTANKPEKAVRRAEPANSDEKASSSRQSEANSTAHTPPRGQSRPAQENTPRKNIFERFFHTNRKPTSEPASPR